MSTSRFGRLLKKALEDVSREDYPLLGAKLGQLIRNHDHTFHPALYGADSLAELLSAQPDLGYVERREKGDLLFHHPDTTPLTGSDNVSDTHSEPPRFLKQDLWQALVNPHADTAAWFDLKNCRLHFPAHNDFDPGQGDEPERYLQVPPIDQKVVRQWASAFIGRSSVEDPTGLDEAIDAPDCSWFRTLSAQLEQRGLLSAWTAFHREQVYHYWDSWAQSHGIASHIGFARPGQARRNQKRRSPQRGLREKLHQVIDDMTEDELRQLLIPARFLIQTNR